MPNIFIILGNRNTRKSATIRALTGAYQRGIYQIESAQGILDVFVQISSLQESNLSPNNFINQINNMSQSRATDLNVLLSLWISAGNNQPDGITYIQRFINAGWNIQEIVVLGSAGLPNLPANTVVPNPRFIPTPQTLAANRIAYDIRNCWGWL